jgi:hypothetical protein
VQTWNKKCKQNIFHVTKTFKSKNIFKKLKLRLKNTIIDKTLTYESEIWIVRKRGWKQINSFVRKVCRRILGPVYDNKNGEY